MFDYIEQDSFLHRRNPVIKLAMIAVITVIVCLSYFPVLPAVTFLVFFFGTWIAGRIPMRNLLRRLLVFLRNYQFDWKYFLMINYLCKSGWVKSEIKKAGSVKHGVR